MRKNPEVGGDAQDKGVAGSAPIEVSRKMNLSHCEKSLPGKKKILHWFAGTGVHLGCVCPAELIRADGL